MRGRSDREEWMGTFIKVNIDDVKCLGPDRSGECVRICPVNIFDVKEGKVVVREENEDECILCNLCLDKCEASAITIRKMYE
jgi:ferredoxin